MFGEQLILGIRELCVDEKSRIFLPDFCYADKNDHVVILDKIDYLEIWNLKDFNELLSKAKLDDYTYSDDITALIVQNDVTIDFHKRVSLTKELTEKYNLKGKVQIEGKGKYIRIWNQDKFQTYKEQIINSKRRVLKKNSPHLQQTNSNAEI